MWCDLCGQAIILNRQDFVIEEQRTHEPGTTLITYMAHQACHEAKAAAEMLLGSNGRTGFTWKPW